MSNFRDYPSLNFVCDDINRISNSLSELLLSSSLTRADRVSVSVCVQKLRSHIATIYHHKLGCEKAMKMLLDTTLSNTDIVDELPF